MSAASQALSQQDRDYARTRAAAFWTITLGMTVALVVAYPPTVALGTTAGWAIAGAFAGLVIGYILRLVRVQAAVSSTELLICAVLATVLLAIDQWLAGGLRSPLQMMLVAHVLGSAAALSRRQRAVHLAVVAAAVLAPAVYGGASASQWAASVVFMIVLVFEALLLVDYSDRVGAQRELLYEAEREASRRAVTDSLTGLGNRFALEAGLATAAQACASGCTSTLVYLDLNGFKAYNDRLGHAAGDDLLRSLGSDLQAGAGDAAHAFHLGGDEFCVLLEGEFDLPDPRIGKIVAALTRQGPDCLISPSVGVVCLPRDAGDPDAALRLADQRMYAHKDLCHRRLRTAATALAYSPAG